MGPRAACFCRRSESLWSDELHSNGFIRCIDRASRLALVRQAGLSDESGAAAHLAMAVKQLGLPVKAEVCRHDYTGKAEATCRLECLAGGRPRGVCAWYVVGGTAWGEASVFAGQ